MTREDIDNAIICLKGIKNYGRDTFTEQTDWQSSLDMAIKALEQEPILDKMRDEVINRYPKNYAGEPELNGNACEFSLNQIIPEGATNGDMIKAMFNIADDDIDEGLSTTYVYTKTRVLKSGSQDYLREQITFNRDWWNAPYKKEALDMAIKAL